MNIELGLHFDTEQNAGLFVDDYLVADITTIITHSKKNVLVKVHLNNLPELLMYLKAKYKLSRSIELYF